MSFKSFCRHYVTYRHFLIMPHSRRKDYKKFTFKVIFHYYISYGHFFLKHKPLQLYIDRMETPLTGERTWITGHIVHQWQLFSLLFLLLKVIILGIQYTRLHQWHFLSLLFYLWKYYSLFSSIHINKANFKSILKLLPNFHLQTDSSLVLIQWTKNGSVRHRKFVLRELEIGEKYIIMYYI